jgi:hypothetical protein
MDKYLFYGHLFVSWVIKTYTMKYRALIIIVAFIAVLICLILVVSLFLVVTPRFMIVLSLIVGIITGVFMTVLIQTLVKNIRNKRLNNE